MKLLRSISAWFLQRRVCAWCRPQRYIGGNPWAARVTHGICKQCAANFLRP